MVTKSAEPPSMVRISGGFPIGTSVWALTFMMVLYWVYKDSEVGAYSRWSWDLCGIHVHAAPGFWNLERRVPKKGVARVLLKG